MTSGSDRRTLLQAMAAAVAMSCLVESGARAGVPGRFLPPAGELLFGRRLVRLLGDGKAVDVRREFAIAFQPRAAGYAVIGRQVSCDVVVPPALEPIARIERARVESGIFPVAVDSSGTIVQLPDAASQAGGTTRMHAASMLQGIIQKKPLSPQDKQDAVLFINNLAEAGGQATSRPPRALFSPPAEPDSQEQVIALPDGQRGVLAVTFSGTADPATGLLREARRLIETRLEGTVQHSREEWTLAPLE